MKNEIKLAEEFCQNYKIDKEGNLIEQNRNKSSYDMMTEFARLHMRGLLEFMKIPEGELIDLYFENLNIKE